MVFIFSVKDDVHPTNVIHWLDEWNVPYFRFNTECLLTDYEFKWWCDASDCDFYIRNIHSGHQVYGHEITAVWDRRVRMPNQLLVNNSLNEINDFNIREAKEFLHFLRFYMKDIFSIGSITWDRCADSKMLQLKVARDLDMKIPDTCYSNRKSFFQKYFSTEEQLSLKPIDGEEVILDDYSKEYLFYSKKVPAGDMFSQPEEAFSQTACFVQKYIEKRYELRVTVCCNDIVACKLDSQDLEEGKGKEDWRQGYDFGLKHEIVQLPDKINTFCIDFLKRMHLNFGCFDFIVTHDGEYVFLECNPNGQWMWIEIYTGFHISKIVARNLAQFESVCSPK